MQVGVRELKAKLSEYLSSAGAGEKITVTDRGRPIAQLVPLAQVSEIDRGIKEGWVDPPRRAKLGVPLLFTADRRSDEVLSEDRGR